MYSHNYCGPSNKADPSIYHICVDEILDKTWHYKKNVHSLGGIFWRVQKILENISPIDVRFFHVYVRSNLYVSLISIRGVGELKILILN